MIDQETTLKLQAYLDGELPAPDAERMADLLEHDSGAQALLGELRAIKAALNGNETEHKVPESREFYWSKIAREIERQEPATLLPQSGRTVWWLRLLVPAGAVALLALAFTVVLWPPSGRSWVALADGHEIETPEEETSSFTFRSEREGMTVVWVDTHRN